MLWPVSDVLQSEFYYAEMQLYLVYASLWYNVKQNFMLCSTWLYLCINSSLEIPHILRNMYVNYGVYETPTTCPYPQPD
jgi:hypothetical protein